MANKHVEQHILIFGDHSLFHVENKWGQVQLKKEVAHLALPAALNGGQPMVNNSGDDYARVPVVSGEYLTHLACGEKFIVASTNHNRVFGIGFSGHCEFSSSTTNIYEWIEVDLGGSLSELLYQRSDNRITRLVCGGECIYIVVNDQCVFSRGSDSDGQLGISGIMGSKCDVFTQACEFTGSKITHMKAGHYHASIVLDHKIIYSTGFNSCGQLGIDSSVGSKNSFTLVTSLPLEDGEFIHDIGLGGAHSAVLTTRGRLFTVGWNSSGELADGSRVSTSKWHLVDVPYPISKLFVDGKGNRTIFMSRDDSQVYGAGSIAQHHHSGVSPLKIPNDVTSDDRVEVQGYRSALFAIYDRSVVQALSETKKLLDLRPMHMTITHLESGNIFTAAIVSPLTNRAYPLLVHRMRDHKLADVSLLFP